MKAFQYLTALGIGTVVSLGDASVVTAQSKTTNPVVESEAVESVEEAQVAASQEIAASALALVPQSAPAQARGSENVEPGMIANGPVDIDVVSADEPALTEARGTDGEQDELEEATDGAEAIAQSAETDAAIPSVDPADLSPADVTPPTVPVESNSDPVEQEFLEEGESSPQDLEPAAELDLEPAAELESLGSSPTPVRDDSPEGLDVQKTDGAVVEETAPASASSLIDQQPNLLRPDQASEVSVVGKNASISLEQALEIARQNNPTIRIRQLQLEQSLAAVDEAKAAYAPSFSVTGDLDNSGTLTSQDLLYQEPNNNFQNNDGDRQDRDASVALGANAQVNYQIIDPDRKARVTAAEVAAKQSRLTLEQDLAALRLDVSQAYYQLQEADEQVIIADKAVKSAERGREDAEALFQAGVGTRFSVLQAQVQEANERQNLRNSRSNQQKSRRQLAQVLSTPEQINLKASDEVSRASLWDVSLEQSIITAYRNRIELDNQLLQRELSDAQREVALSATKPSLSAFAQAGPGLRWDFNRSTTLDNGNSTQSGTRRGTLGYVVGLDFRWTFSDGGASKAAARQQELNKAIAEENFESIRDQVRREVEDAFYDLAANLLNIETAEKGVGQAEEALRLADLRRKAGVGTQGEVIDAERDLTTARGNRVSAILNYNRALVQMHRATGETLPEPSFTVPEYVEE